MIYETLDNNIELLYYHLSNKITFLKRFTLIKKIYEFSEKIISKYFCDEIIVNSKALVRYFAPIHSNLLYYTSPFENKINITHDKDTAFLYLGGFWKMKGCKEILNITKKYNKKLFIFGTAHEIEIINEIKLLEKEELVFFKERISSSVLEKKIIEILDEYKLIGFSLTKEVNISNATQEINKDIDYLAMGIPIIGNKRKPTAEKIEAGCGIFIHDTADLERLLTDSNFYKEKSHNCINHYSKYYAQSIFDKNLLQISESLVQRDELRID